MFFVRGPDQWGQVTLALHVVQQDGIDVDEINDPAGVVAAGDGVLGGRRARDLVVRVQRGVDPGGGGFLDRGHGLVQGLAGREAAGETTLQAGVSLPASIMTG
ncbi:hypothetical protein [Pseudoxanthomonas sp.]|uniref:hypothetical protein n=1 Tax=Pseudoxanthomonas sp. TaxID=1871049 RepID=UPI0025894579|nr:hypothetical protein [Pseudoxanthomonas sp.]MCR6687177.1 hypothetical protein [Pseudoxanthomonas sp.]